MLVLLTVLAALGVLTGEGMSIMDPLPERESWLDPGDYFADMSEDELDKDEVMCGNCTNFTETDFTEGCGWCTAPIPMWADLDEGSVQKTTEADDCSLFMNKWKVGKGTIPDRRRLTANDRAVERIKDLATTPAVHMEKFGPGATSMALWFLDIIREEAERER